MLGIGGGGDVVAALASARLCQTFGAEAVVGGVAWERLPIDPHAGPRGPDEIVDSRPLAEHVVFAGPETRTAGGVLFAESLMARFLGEQTVLVDVLAGPEAVASSLAKTVEVLGADLLVCIDAGGDVLGDGSEPGLASPLCDAVMLAAATRLQQQGLATLGGVFGACCDGELTVEELLDRLAALAASGGLLGAWGLTEATIRELEDATRVIPTEVSAQAIRCARGEIGTTTIRRGRRSVPLSPLGALTFYFDPATTVASVAPLARAVIDARSLDHANDLLHEVGIRTELDFEREFTEA